MIVVVVIFKTTLGNIIVLDSGVKFHQNAGIHVKLVCLTEYIYKRLDLNY